MPHKIRTDENSKFTLHKTAIADWYSADEVDKLLTELVKQMCEISETLEKMKRG